VPLPALNEWTTFRIGIADLIARGNSVSCCPGIADLKSILNIFVVEPSGEIDIEFDKVRFVVPVNFEIFGDTPNPDLSILSYNPDGLVTTLSETVADRGNVFRLIKTAGGQGNAFFNFSAGARDISD